MMMFIFNITANNKITTITTTIKMKTIIDFKNFKDEEELENYINNSNLTDVEILNLEKVGNGFLYYNKNLKNLTVPNLKILGDKFLYYNEKLKNLTAPKLKIVGHGFLRSNKNLKKLSLPNLKEIGNSFLHYNENLKTFIAPNLKKVGGYFLFYNENLEKFINTNLKEIGDCFLYNNENLKTFKAPNLKKVGDYSLCYNKNLKDLIVPNLEIVGDSFLCNNEKLNIYNIKTKIKTVAKKDTIVFKKMRTGEIIQFLLKKGTKFQIHDVKARAEYLFAIEDVDYKSFYNQKFDKKYSAGDKIEPDYFDVKFVNCSNGIHFFFNEEDAMNYKF